VNGTWTVISYGGATAFSVLGWSRSTGRAAHLREGQYRSCGYRTAHVGCGSKCREDEQVLDLGRQILQALTVRDHAIVRYSPRSIHVGFDHQVGTNRGCLLQVWRSVGRRNPTAYVNGSSSQKTHQGTKRGDRDEQDKVRPNAPQCFHRIHRLRTRVLGSHVLQGKRLVLSVKA
jgi:hypothetical protein